MRQIDLCGNWKLWGRNEEDHGECIPEMTATVPGCAQLELSKAGILPEDLYMGNNIISTEKYEVYEWWYERRFDAPDERERVFLVFEGVDCIAEYYLNGELIGVSDNMFIPFEFDVSKYLRDGENTLKVHIKSPVVEANKRDYTVRSMSLWEKTPADTGVRRAPHSFGWDIMPRCVTSGIWRPVRIEIRDEIRFDQLYFCPRGKNCDLYYEIKCDWSQLEGLEIEAEGYCGDSSFYAKSGVYKGRAARMPLTINDPKLWWPYGYGDANVYDATVRILKNGTCVHEQKATFGLRDIVLDRTDTTDGKNGKFRFLINGVEIMCRGSNWVPMDAFHCRDAERYAKALELVKDIGCNILRCWGGNVYEDHEFFDFCDRNGIMVGQDFAMGCKIYPQDREFRDKIEREAATIVRRLRNHPSIILWAGDNEIDQMSMGFGFDPANNKLTREVLPEAVRQNDLTRPYLPSSPYVCGEIFEKGDLSLLPEHHLWGPRDYFKSDYYKNSNAHFVSETGYHGCPCIESIKKFITPDKVWHYRDNDQWILHSSDQYGNPARVLLMEEQVRQLFGEIPEDPEEYILASQISQAEAKKFFIERIRAGRPIKTGIIWWNLLDGWPQMSDAVVDYYYEKKLAYGYIKNSQAVFSIVCDELSSRKLRFYACNDTLMEKSGEFTVCDAMTDEILLEGRFVAEANTSTLIGDLMEYYSTQRILAIRWKADGEEGFNHYLCGYPPISFELYKAFLKKYEALLK